MATDYISREAALDCFTDWIDRYGHEHTADEMTEYQKIEELPAADVREVADVDALVDKATRIINGLYTAMPYEVYCKILNAVEDIYSMNKKDGGKA